MTTTYIPGDLVQAARYRDFKGVVDLLEQGANPNERDEDGETPLIWMACYGQLELVKLLIKKGADIDAQETGTGRTALIYAVRNITDFIPFDHEDTLRFLIESGASLDITDNDGLTALDWAKKEHKTDAAIMLQEAMDRQQLIATEKAAREAEQQRVAELHGTAAARQDILKKHAQALKKVRPT